MPTRIDQHGRDYTLFTGGHQLHVRELGTGEPLLLLMGLGGNVEMWSPLLAHLTGRRVLAFDAPGTGRSTTPIMPVPVPALADIAAAVLDRAGVGLADVLGYSYGGAVAQQLAVSHPHRVRRLVLAATNAGVGSEPANPDASTALLSPVRYYHPGLFAASAQTVYGGNIGRDPALQAELYAARSSNPPSAYGYALQLIGGAGWSSLPFLHEIIQQTLVLCGDDDPLVPIANSRLLADRIPNAQLRVLTGSGHLLVMDDARRCALHIGRFLAESLPE